MQLILWIKLNLYFLSILFILSSCNNRQESQNNFSEEDSNSTVTDTVHSFYKLPASSYFSIPFRNTAIDTFKGNVKEVKIYYRFAAGGEKKSSLTEHLFFNKAGSISRIIEYNDSGKWDDEKYYYDSNGQLKAVKDEDLDTAFYVYNKAQQLIAVRQHDDVDSFQYDSRNNIIAHHLIRKGNPVYKDIYQYDTQNNIIRWYKNQSFSRSKSFEHTDTITKVKTDDRDGTRKVEEETFIYNKVGSLIQYSLKSHRYKTTVTTTYIYNARNLITAEEIIEYPDHGLQNKKECSYEYDKNDNWIKKTCYNNEGLYDITERKISYY